jgi:hypothetical protein
VTAEEFVECCAKERETLIEEYMNTDSNLFVAREIASLNLNQAQQAMMRGIVGQILTDVFYTVLLALDGAASLGGKQTSYKLYDEDGNELTGQLERLAWERLQESL